MDFAWGLIACLSTIVLALGLRDALQAPALHRTNYAGRDVITGGGVVAIFGYLSTAALLTIVNHNRAGWLYDTTLMVCGFGLVGLLDDMIGGSGARGFRGHIAAARSGQLTSGALKLALGVAIAFIATLTTEGFGVQLLRVIVIAGAANVFNLLDLAPGRASKSAVVFLLPVLVLERAHEYFVVGPIMFTGAILGLLLFEMREELMLGDAGSNALGAAIGSAWVIAVAGNNWALAAVALVVVAINVAGEIVSFSRVIDRVGVLRAFDRWGRRT